MNFPYVNKIFACLSLCTETYHIYNVMYFKV